VGRRAIDYDVYTTEELLEMSHEDAIEGLTEKQIKFCEVYVLNYNISIALRKAGYESETSGAAYRIRQKPGCKRYIQWLKARMLHDTLINGEDIINQWVKIAFADMTDFVDINKFGITLKPVREMDGQLVKSIKSGRDGVSIELYDKLKALDSLAKYTEDMPKDYKQKIEERKMELMEQEFELKKSIYDMENKIEKDDGFVEALKQSAKIVWEQNEI
jgi:phage terminase small subunit